jgi:predicted SnoaL-like aldol condensation-catalyzing enzyme
MKRRAAVSALLLVVCGGAGLAQTTNASKQLIIDFFEFRGGREERAAKFQTEDYVQHHPRFLRMDEFTGARGRQAWMKAGEEAQRRGGISLVALGGIPLRNPIILMAEGDLMVAVYKGSLRDPKEPDKTYDAFAFEAFRVRNGQFSEHSDQVRLARGWMTPPPPQPAGVRAGGAAQPAATPPPSPVPEPKPGCSVSAATLAANKKLVVSTLDRAPKATPPRTVEMVVAECDYVSVVWKQVLPDPDTPTSTWEAFTFDTYRVSNGQLAQHWDGSTR